MQGQASKLSTIADNIANANSNGYKRFGIEFSTLVVNGGSGNYNSGGVVTTVRQAVSQQGVLQYSNSATDLAIDGNGFFVVQDASGNSFLTRAGSFVPDAQGQLINAAGYYLTGYSYANGEPSVVVNSFDGLEPVAVTGGDLTATASTEAAFSANLPAEAPVVTGSLPSLNVTASEYTEKTSMVVYDDLGGETILDIYFSKTGANTWDVTVFDQAAAAAGTSFPYSAGPLATQAITFDPAQGVMSGATSLSIPVPGGQAMTPGSRRHDTAVDRLHRLRRLGQRQRAGDDRARRFRHRRHGLCPVQRWHDGNPCSGSRSPWSTARTSCAP